MTHISTKSGGGVPRPGNFAARLLVLLCCLSLSAFLGATSPFIGEDAPADRLTASTINWTSSAPGLLELKTEAIEEYFAADVSSTANMIVECFTGFSAGDDQANCAGTTVILDGGWDSYSGPDENTDGGGVSWHIVSGSTTGSFEVGGFATNANIAFGGSPVGNFLL